MTHVVVHQISSSSGKEAYLNVEEKLGYVKVWCYASYPTLLIQNDRYFELVQFDDEETMKEYLEKAIVDNTTVTVLKGAQ